MKQYETIHIFVKNVYGKETIYPACDKSRIFADLTRKKTLDMRDLKNIAELGFIIKNSQGAISDELARLCNLSWASHVPKLRDGLEKLEVN